MQQSKTKKQNALTANSQKLKATRGFTLIETLIAITVLLLSITAPLHIASQALFSAFYARDEITAYYLAEEAIEYIKNSRDTRFLADVFDSGGAVINDDAWLVGLEDCIEDPITGRKRCTVDATLAFMGGNAVGPCPDSIFLNI